MQYVPLCLVMRGCCMACHSSDVAAAHLLSLQFVLPIVQVRLQPQGLLYPDLNTVYSPEVRQFVSTFIKRTEMKSKKLVCHK